MYSTLSRCLRITRFERWTTYWRRRMSPTERRVFTKHSSRIPSRIFGSGSTPLGRVMKLQVLSYRVVTRMETYATERSHQHQTTGKAIKEEHNLITGHPSRSTEKNMSDKLKDKIALITG